MQQIAPDIVKQFLQERFWPVLIGVILASWLASQLFQSSCNASCTDRLQGDSLFPVSQSALDACISSCTLVPGLWFVVGGAVLGYIVGGYIQTARQK